MESYERVIPMERASNLDNGIRRLVQNPGRILKSHVRDGMVVLELGCGPGFFTPEIARRVGGSGKVIAADLQEEMLDHVRKKIRGTDIEGRIELHKCEADRIGIQEKVDLALVFFMFHEVVAKRKVLKEIKSILKPGGRLYIIELRWHPPKKTFDEMMAIIRDVGFEEVERPNFLLSRAVIVK